MQKPCRRGLRKVKHQCIKVWKTEGTQGSAQPQKGANMMSTSDLTSLSSSDIDQMNPSL